MIARKLVEKNTRDLRKKCLKSPGRYGIILNRDILVFVWSCKAHDRRISLLPAGKQGAKRPKGGAHYMNKYELAVVVNAKKSKTMKGHR